MDYILLNAGAILIAAAAGLAAGLTFWAAFGRTGRPFGARALITAALAETWLCAILAGALILAPPRGGAWTMGLGSALVIWLGFVAPALAATHAYRGLPARAAGVDALRWLIVMLVQAAVLILIGLTPPGR